MTTPTPTPTPETVAANFLTALRAEIGEANYRTVCERNAAAPDATVCHSHDFCDANMVMLAVLTDLGFDEDSIVAQDDDALVSLWNTGWNLAFDQMAQEGAQPLRQRDVVPDPSDVVEPDLHAIAGHLAKLIELQSAPTVEYPGCVVVWGEDLGRPDASWWFGTANATWMGDLQTADGQHLGHLETSVSSNETDPLVIAKAIAEALQPSPDTLDDADLVDLLERTVSIMETTNTDNPNETVAEAHSELYLELKHALTLKGGAR